MMYMQCEFCTLPATRRVTCAPLKYRRFSCPEHHAKVDRLVALDLGDRKRITLTNPTGFNAANGRVCGP